jgi:hypothetical protein
MPRTKRYAAQTEVPVDRSRAAIESLLITHGATKYATGWDTGHDTIQFELFHRVIRFVLPRPDAAKLRKDKYAQADRQRWRALYLVLRAKIEAVEAGIAIFEQEFLAFVVLPSGVTIGDSLVPLLRAGRDLPALGPPPHEPQ